MPQNENLLRIASALEKVAEELEKSAKENKAQYGGQPDYGSLGEASHDNYDPLTRFILN